jgi:GNAT superfamily N-acetyltransferase
MYEILAETTLKSGLTAEIGLLTAPDPADALGVAPLLGHKGGIWQTHIERALAGELDGLETRFYLARVEGLAVCNVMTVEFAGAGILGHVFTRPEHRRQGLCEAVFAQLQPHFRARGGLRLTLGTGFESSAYWIYHRHGFRPLLPSSGFMSWAVAPDFADRWYAPAPAVVQPLAWRHWPALAQLLADDFGDGLQAMGLNAFGPVNFEGSGLALLQDSTAQVRVLETASKAVALASLSPDRRWPTVTDLDLIGHPAWSAEWPRLLAALTLPPGKTQCWLPPESQARRAAVESLGFQLEATLTGQRPDGGDVLAFALNQ